MTAAARLAKFGGSWLGWIVATFLVTVALAIPLYRAGTLRTLGGVQFGASDWVMSDFRSVVYYPAKAFRDGLNPYDAARYLPRYPVPEPFRAYPPAMLLVAQPFALLPPGAAVRAQVALTLVLTAALAWWSLSLVGSSQGALGVTVLSSLILLSRPGHWNLLQGHITVVIVLAVYAALAVPRTRVALGALALAVALLKPNFGVPLAVLMLAAGRTRAVVAGLAVTALLNVPVLAVLSERSGGVVRTLRLMVEGGSPEASELASQYALFRVDASALVSRFAGVSLGPVLPFMLGAGVLGLAAVLTRRRLRMGGEGWEDPVWVGLACTAILLCVYHIGYDLLLLVWPATAIVVAFVTRGGERSRRAWVELGLVGILAGNYLATYAFMQVLGFGTVPALLAVSLNGLAVSSLFALYAGDALSGASARTWAQGARSFGAYSERAEGTLAEGRDSKAPDGAANVANDR